MISNDKKFELKLDKANKTVLAKVFGSFGPADANGFMEEYMHIVKSIKTSEYKLVFDNTGLSVLGKDTTSGVDMTAMLKGCIEQYKNDNWNEVTIDCGKNIVLKMQARRLAKEVGIANFTIL